MSHLQGPNEEELWKRLSLENWNGEKVQARHGEWVITLDTYQSLMMVGDVPIPVEYTRIRAPYLNRDGFHFFIYRKNFFSEFSKWLGMQDIEVGHPELDEPFIIQGDDEKKVRALFAHPTIRELVQSQQSIALAVRGDQGWFERIFPEGVDELYFQAEGKIQDAERLRALFNLFCVTLDQLHAIGSADRKSAGVEL